MPRYWKLERRSKKPPMSMKKRQRHDPKVTADDSVAVCCMLGKVSHIDCESWLDSMFNAFSVAACKLCTLCKQMYGLQKAGCEREQLNKQKWHISTRTAFVKFVFNFSKMYLLFALLVFHGSIFLCSLFVILSLYCCLLQNRSLRVEFYFENLHKIKIYYSKLFLTDAFKYVHCVTNFP
jgi:hypothetical protein